MDDQYWDSLLAGLNVVQLRQLGDKINKRLAQQDNARDTLDPVSFNAKRATFYSNASTLISSGRSTPVAGSISSGRTPSLLSTHGDALNQSLPTSTESHMWPMHTASNHLGDFQSSLRQKTLHKTLNDHKAAESASKQFFCIFCSELGIQKIIKTKQDWKRHEEDYHGTGLQWICQIPGCSASFFSGVDFKDHLKKGHEGKKYPRDCKDVRQLGRVYACGFENCRVLLTVWKHHCDHVAMHMVEGETNWSYNRTIRNLLKHQDVSAYWKQTYTTLCPQLQVLHSDLTWDSHTTRKMREQLGTRPLEGRLDELLLNLFYSGLPPAKASDFVAQPSQSNWTSSSLYHAPPVIPPVLPSSMEPFSLYAPLRGTDAPHVTTDHESNETTASLLNHRNSIFMTDAPPLGGPDLLNTTLADPFEEIPSMADELVTLENFITETTPDYEPHLRGIEDQPTVLDHSKSHSPRALMTKGKGWLTSKKSQHFQPHVIEHPDVPANMRLPSCSPRKKSSTTGHGMRNV